MFDITALGEILIDFTYQGKNEDGQKLFAQNPGGAPANALTAASRLGAKCAFLGKAGEDMHGRFLKDVLRQEGINTDGFLLDPQVFTTLAFVELSPEGERSFSFARKPGADTQISRAELKPEILKDGGQYFLDKGIKYFGQSECLSIFRNGADSTHDLLLKNKIPLQQISARIKHLNQR